MLFFIIQLFPVNCGDPVLEEVTTFHSNRAPSIRNIVILDSDQNVFNPGSPVLPGNLFYLTIETEEFESEKVEFFYSADISGSDDDGSFNNKLVTGQGGSIVIGTVTYALPETLPRGEQVTLTISAEDSTGARSTYTFLLGPVKPPPRIEDHEDGPIITSNEIIVNWWADYDCYYYYYTSTTDTIDCDNIDINELVPLSDVQVFKFTAGQQRFTNSYFNDVTDIRFYIIVFDALEQYACLEYSL